MIHINKEGNNMIIDFRNFETEIITNMRGGAGLINIKRYVDERKTIAIITIPPKSSIGIHTHKGDDEVIYVLSGSGICIDNGIEIKLVSGLVNYCPEGKEHSVVNDGLTDLEIFIVITKYNNE